jgi:hypothetical protein
MLAATVQDRSNRPASEPVADPVVFGESLDIFMDNTH